MAGTVGVMLMNLLTSGHGMVVAVTQVTNIKVDLTNGFSKENGTLMMSQILTNTLDKICFPNIFLEVLNG